jgi:triacylglycerol lipase
MGRIRIAASLTAVLLTVLVPALFAAPAHRNPAVNSTPERTAGASQPSGSPSAMRNREVSGESFPASQAAASVPVRPGLPGGAAIQDDISIVPPADAAAAMASRFLTAGGPALTVPVETLRSALSCPASFGHIHEPVLLVHGLPQTPDEAWSSNYAKVLPPQGFDVCTVALPDFARGDVQVQTEYVVHAILAMGERGSGKIDVVAFSVGTLGARAAMKWWPDARALVDDLVMIAGPHHGDANFDILCAVPCIAPLWQMKASSRFLGALNAGDETPGDVSYTSAYSRTDLAVQPELPSHATSDLSGASNIAIQDLCPGRFVDHAQSIDDAAFFTVVMDALTHSGPADPARIDRSVCAQVAMPGVDALQVVARDVNWWGNVAVRGFEPRVAGEPALAPWAVP